MDLKSFVRSIPDFPKKGIIFRDITTLIQNPEAFNHAVNELVKKFEGVSFDVIVGVESRGFIFGSPIALKLGKGFVLARKKGKLPYRKVDIEYKTEYSIDCLEIHEDAIHKDDRVLIIDDLLATGGTVKAVRELIEKMGGIPVGAGFVIELPALKGREKLNGLNVESLISFGGL